MATGGIAPTDEQQAVVAACSAGANLVIEAGAGTGKTSTLRMAATAMAGRAGLYLAYNRATAQSARTVFPAAVQCATAHSLAYRAVGWRYADRLPDRAGRVPAWAIAHILGIGEPLLLGDKLIITAAHQARIVMGTVERFCYSADRHISSCHVPPVNGLDDESFGELTWRIVPYAERAWSDIQSWNGKLPCKHDHYLKMWQLGDPVIPVDYILFDEAQDANPATSAIIQRQDHAQQIAVGDSCQAIYGWRGAVDALSTWPADTRLHLSHSFRFGQAVAEEANKWLVTLSAEFRLSGTNGVDSTIGTVGDPHAILCRTNAEALLQARAALDAGRRVALGGGGHDIRQLALAALELQAAGRTSNHELAAFRSWDSVRQFVLTDAAGADLAAIVRLIDTHGAAMILGTVEQLSREARADILVATAHRAKGLQWGRVLVARDFRFPEPRPESGQESPVRIPRADAMLAYVAITRARYELDPGGLTWIDDYDGRVTTTAVPAATNGTMRREIIMPDLTAIAQQVDDPPPEPRHYQGGRAQAESGSRIIENDFAAWKTVATGPDAALAAGHPRMQQLAQAWRSVSKHRLTDGPGPAATRYQVLAHAAAALTETAVENKLTAEASALGQLAGHSRQHAERLRATAEHFFARSHMAGAYEGGRAQANGGSHIVEHDYQSWTATAAATQAANSTELREHAKRLEAAWQEVRRHGLSDGPEPAAVRFQELSDAASAVAANFLVELPSAALTSLLDIASHAGKHAIRLRATATATARSVAHQEQARVERSPAARAAASDGAYQNLPEEISKLSVQAHSDRVPNARFDGDNRHLHAPIRSVDPAQRER